MGFTCDLTALPADYRRKMKRFIADFKRKRDFYLHADARILCESEGLTAIQYSDRDFSDVRIQLFTQKLRQDRLTVYPVLDPTRTSRVGKSNAAPASGDLLSRTGVTFRDLSKFDFYEIDLTSAKQAKNK